MKFQLTFRDEGDQIVAHGDLVYKGYSPIVIDNKRLLVTNITDDNFLWNNPLISLMNYYQALIAPIVELSYEYKHEHSQENDKFFDIELDVGYSLNQRFIFSAHRSILENSSTFFRRLLNENPKKKRYTISWDIDEFNYVLDIMYGMQLVLSGIEGVRLLDAVLYFGLSGIDIQSLIAAMDIVNATNCIEFLEIIHRIYPEGLGDHSLIVRYLSYVLEIYYENDEPVSFFQEIWDLLPVGAKKHHNYMLYERDDLAD